MEPYFYEHPFAADVLAREKLDNLEASGYSIRPFVQTVLEFPILFRAGQPRVKLDECWVCGAKAPEDHPDAFPLRLHRGRELFCEQGNHTITIRQLLKHFAKDEKQANAMLMKLGQLGNPSLTRFYCFESGQERTVSEDPNACRELFIQAGEKVRGVIIECPHLDLAKQLAGQPGSRKKMSFCESVALREDQTLADIRWHGAYLTEPEKRLLRAQQERDELERKQQQGRALRAFQRSQQL